MQVGLPNIVFERKEFDTAYFDTSWKVAIVFESQIGLSAVEVDSYSESEW